MTPKAARKGMGEGKAKSKGKKKGEVRDKPRAKNRTKAKDKGKGKGEAKDKARGKRKGKAKGNGKPKGKGKAKAKDKARGKRKVKAKGKTKGKGQTKAKARRAKPEQINLQIVTAEELTPAMAPTEEAAGAVGAQRTRRRWMQVVTNLGLEKHVRAVSEWEGQGAAPILTGFSFVRHVESEARDLRCAGTSVAMTQGVVVKREDGKLFLIGRGVAKKYLGMEVPWKNRANAGQRFLTVQERAELGQPLSESLNTERH